MNPTLRRILYAVTFETGGILLGGLILGLLEAFGTQIPGIGSEWKDVFSFAVLIAVLVLKPTGLLGKSEQERM